MSAYVLNFEISSFKNITFSFNKHFLVCTFPENYKYLGRTVNKTYDPPASHRSVMERAIVDFTVSLRAYLFGSGKNGLIISSRSPKEALFIRYRAYEIIEIKMNHFFRRYVYTHKNEDQSKNQFESASSLEFASSEMLEPTLERCATWGRCCAVQQQPQ